ncbi:MAG: SDR family oxidoreductase [Chloroflexota bacterium]|nr:SDR family oxidoreductase [Chloroflexota bacterium]
MGFIHDRLDMSERVAIVTGGGRNLGRGIALGLADAGAAVVIAEIDEETGPAMERELRDAGHDALFIHTNVRDADSVDALIAGTVERFGRLDVMVANAGGMFQAPALDISKRGFEAVIDLNLIGTWLCNTAAARAMIEGGRGGSIINMSSQNALYGALNGPHYGAAKAGILGLTLSVAAEWAEHGIRVNAVAPGGRTARAGAAPREGQLAGGGDPEYIENVAAATVYLASDLASWVTGHTLVVDDGGTFTNAAPRGA